jgi:arsenate reductase
MKKKVLFICTHNSCRSQMAEGMVNHILGDTWAAYSAGMEASSVHPKAAQVMNEIGIDISHQRSKSLDDLPDAAFDLVVTLCSDAEQRCPLYSGSGKRVHIGFEDPAEATGTDEDVVDAFRRVRDEIKGTILDFLKSYN